MQLGVRLLHGRAYHPQTQGKDERFHRTLEVELLQARRFADVSESQIGFDRWRRLYNEERPHDSLGMAVSSGHDRALIPHTTDGLQRRMQDWLADSAFAPFSRGGYSTRLAPLGSGVFPPT